ncbi:MAG TPA: DUF1178 family protein [Burkholderiaceae bacterium]
MKVLNLQCAQQHVFEGWFGSEDDFQAQCERALVACPLCGDTAVTKLPSAPRLNLRANASLAGSAHSTGDAVPVAQAATVANVVAPAVGGEGAALQAAWMALARKMVERSEDVGERFTDEARRMHYGEAPERGIRGQATPAQALELLEEGIGVIPLPEALKGPLQ